MEWNGERTNSSNWHYSIHYYVTMTSGEKKQALIGIRWRAKGVITSSFRVLFRACQLSFTIYPFAVQTYVVQKHLAIKLQTLSDYLVEVEGPAESTVVDEHSQGQQELGSDAGKTVGHNLKIDSIKVIYTYIYTYIYMIKANFYIPYFFDQTPPSTILHP